jgi:predicted secreted protein
MSEHLSSQVLSTITFGTRGGEASLNIEIADEFVIEAKTNPSTGYNWYPAGPIPSCLELLSTDYRSSVSEGSHVVGAPSILRLRFKALRECVVRLEYVYKRPWEDTKADDTTMTINLSVQSTEDL